MCKAIPTIRFLFLLLPVLAMAQPEGAFRSEVSHAGRSRQADKQLKTANYLRQGNRLLRRDQYRNAVRTSFDAYTFCDEIKAYNLRGLTEAAWGKLHAANRSLQRGAEEALEDGRDADTLLFNRALLNLRSGDPDTALGSLLRMDAPEAFSGALFNRALARAYAGDFPAAVSDFEQVIQSDSSDGEAFLQMGLALWQLEEYDRAEGAFQAADQRLSANASLEVALALAAVRRGDFETVLNRLEKARSLDPRNLSVLLALGTAKNRMGQFAAAKRVFEKALEQDPRSAAAHCGLGNALFRLGRDEEALQAFTRALHWNPALPEAFVGQAHILSRRGEYTEAIKLYSRALQYQPEHLHALEGRAIALFRIGWYELARADFSQVRSLAPMHKFSYDAHIAEGFAAFHLGIYADAVEPFKQASRIDPSRAEAFDGLGCAFYELEDFAASIENFNLAIGLAPENDVMLTNRGNALYRIERYEEAKADFEKAAAVNPSNEHAWNGLGIANNSLKNYEVSVQSMEKALALDPLNEDLYINQGYSRGLLASWQLQQADSLGARATWQRTKQDHWRMLQLFGDTSVFHINLGYLYTKMGHLDSALLHFDSVAQPAYFKYATNNKGNVWAMRENLDQAHAFYNQAIAMDPEEKYAEPRVNRALSGQYLGRPSPDDFWVAETIQRSSWRHVLDRDKYVYTVFYYAIMRYLPPPPSSNFENDLAWSMPGWSEPRGQYILYPADQPCLRRKEARIRRMKLRNKGKVPVFDGGCPE